MHSCEKAMLWTGVRESSSRHIFYPGLHLIMCFELKTNIFKMATETHFSNESKMVADVTASVINDFKGAEAHRLFKVTALGSLQPLSSSLAVSSLDCFRDAFPPHVSQYCHIIQAGWNQAVSVTFVQKDSHCDLKECGTHKQTHGFDIFYFIQNPLI